VVSGEIKMTFFFMQDNKFITALSPSMRAGKLQEEIYQIIVYTLPGVGILLVNSVCNG
jgi:hypothetical protein